ncbi:uncharacterized protein LOC117226351 isoform X1 [Megalopta genalis]|uniref:uncharacterized protein LOC117226351 isoform X1 n=2 Tax=Megalopta genalis TaxID=115081 RepID=UPI003FD66606
MGSTDRDLKQKHDIEQMAVIGKMHNMQWLKSNSQFSGHMKVFPDGKELICTPLKTKVNEGSKDGTDVSVDSASNSPQLENNDCIMNECIGNNNIITNNNTLESTLKVVDPFGESIMETTWNKNVNIASTLLPNSQEIKKMNSQENIVNVTLEHLRLEEARKIKSSEMYNESSNKWDTIHGSSDTTKADNNESNQINSKQCHDNNNNNAKSKAQTAPELQKGMQKSTNKININKTNDHKVKKQPGNSIKMSSTTSKQISKDQDDSLHSYKNEKISSTDSRKNSVPVTKYDKCSKVNGYNKQLYTGKGTQMKEQQFYKQNFSTFNDNGDRRRTMEVLDEKNRSQRKSSDIDDSRKCHKVQTTRTQSYNVQYNRNKPLVKSQQQYLRDTFKEEENSINHTPGFNDNTNSTENGLKKKCETKCNTNERPMGRPSGSVSCRRNYQNASYAKTNNDRTSKDEQGSMQKFKKDSHTYRRSSGTFQPFPKDANGKEKTDDYKKTVPDYSSKDYKANQSEGSKISVCSHKTTNGASNNKTDTSDSTVNNLQSTRSLNSWSNSTKDPANISVSVNMSQESHLLQAPCNGTEVQFAKTEQDHTSNNSSSKMSTSSSEAKSVKFSDNVQEIHTAGHSESSLHTNNVIQHHKVATNSYYSDLQPASSVSNAQQLESHQNVQNKSYFDNSGAQVANQNAERNMYLLDLANQKSEQQNNCNPSMTMSNVMPYSSISPVYLNQYNNVQNTARKTADSSIVTHNTLVPSTSSYTMENQSIMQAEPSNILMHSPQTSVLPTSSGYHNHPAVGQHNQWNLSLPDMLLFGNMMNTAQPMNMQMHNSRHMCGTDFNSIQQGYMQPPMYYVPQLCMQGWNPMMQYPPLFQNTPFSNCSAYPNQVLPSSTTADSINCTLATSMQSNPYKQYQQIQQLESNPSYSVPIKLDNYIGSMQGCKSTNVRMKDNAMDVHARTRQYRVPLANDYQSCIQDGQGTMPYSYGIAMDPARSGSTNMHMQLSQKYAPRATANYQRMPDHCSMFQSNQDLNRKDDASKNDSECTPPMVSPRECMYYGMNYSRKPDIIQNSTLHSDVKPSMAYMGSLNTQPYVPQYHKSGNYHASSKELASRATFGRSIRKSMEQ